MRGTSREALRWVLLLVVAIGGSPASAATLRWKFKPGETLHYEMNQKTVTSVNAGGDEQSKETVTMITNMTWAIKSVDAEGKAELTQTIDRVRIKIEAALGTFQVDSKETKSPLNPLEPYFKALIGTPFPFKMDAQGVLSDVKVPESVIQSLRELGGGAAGGNAMFTEDGLKTMITQSSVPLPKEDLAVGKTWSQQEKIPTPPLGSMTLSKTFRYQGPGTVAGAELEKVGVEVVAGVESEPGVASQVKIAAQDIKGELAFDNTAGRIAQSNLSEKIERVLSILNADKKVNITQKTDTTLNMKLVPDAPADAAKPAK
ncbi:DUF6263 family protein [Singulisphaera rosea]